MKAALKLAGKGLGTASPNPAVGAVVVKNKKIISTGYHRRPGTLHAEAEALKKAGKLAKGADLYVTLEPCCTYGRTPPCTKAIIGAGVKRVFAGMKDPNPKVSGRGIRELRSAGIEAFSGILEKECALLNEAYSRYIQTGLPFVHLKLASTLDGRIATSTGESRWISNERSRKLVHRMRSVFDAVMAGSNTVIKDDPELTVRMVKGRNPKRIIVDTFFKSSLDSKVFKIPGTIVLTTSRASDTKIKRALAMGVNVIKVKRSKDGVDLKDALEKLGSMEITGILVEGGSKLAASLLKARLVDKISVCVSPVFIGQEGLPSVGSLEIKKLLHAIRLKDVTSKRVGEDTFIEGYL